MGEPSDDCRILVFVRPSNVKPTRSLAHRMKTFLLTGEGTECLDHKQFSVHLKAGKIADYLLWNRQFIAELKQIEGYPAARMTKLMNEALRQEPRIDTAITVRPRDVHVRSSVDRLIGQQEESLQPPNSIEIEMEFGRSLATRSSLGE